MAELEWISLAELSQLPLSARVDQLARTTGGSDTPSHDNDLGLWRQIQGGIAERFTCLAPDPAARDAAGVARLPGSIHSGTGTRVFAWSQLDAERGEFAYSLVELAEFVRIARPANTPRTDGKGPDAVRRGYLRRQGWAIKARRQFETLRALRGGFRDGHRHRAVLLYATLLRRCGLKRDDVLEKVMALGDECRTHDGKALVALTNRGVFATVQSALAHRSRRNPRNDTILDWIDITPEEARELETWGPAARFGAPQPALSRAARQQ